MRVTLPFNFVITLLVLLRPWHMPAADSPAAAVQTSSLDQAGSTPSSLSSTGLSARAIAFYYPWYGNPETDRRYANWNHPVAVRNEPARSYPGGDDIGANFYPALGCYSVNDPKVLHEHARQLRQAGVGVICASWSGSLRSMSGTKARRLSRLCRSKSRDSPTWIISRCPRIIT